MSTAYERYVEQQAVILSQEDLERQKQEDDHKLVYNDLLARFHLLQNSLNDEKQRVDDLKSIIRDYMKEIESFKERVIEIPFSRINMFLFQENPKSIFVCVDSSNKLLWAKAPEEMEERDDQRISR